MRQGVYGVDSVHSNFTADRVGPAVGGLVQAHLRKLQVYPVTIPIKWIEDPKGGYREILCSWDGIKEHRLVVR